MNRIILIGNGFDLAHGLPTRYKDFIKGYHNMRSNSLIHDDGMKVDDGLCIYEVPDSDSRNRLNHVRSLIMDKRFSYYAKNCIEDIFQRLRLKYSSKFFEEINKAVDAYNWVDIEAVYYRWLTKIFKQSGCEYVDPNKLNSELKLLEDNFIIYLAIIQNDFIKPELKIESIENAIYESFDIKDMSNESQSIFKEFVENRWNVIQREDKSERRAIACRYGYPMGDKEYELKEYIRIVSDLSGHWNNMQNGPYTTPNYFLLPDQILFLNFNYTSTADLYIPKGSEFKINHIHGELGNGNNPIIFGYGDELDDDYKEISKLNDTKWTSWKIVDMERDPSSVSPRGYARLARKEDCPTRYSQFRRTDYSGH